MSLTHQARTGGQSSSRSELLFDQAMQMIANRWVIKPLDDFVQKSSDEEPLGNLCRNAARAQVKQLVFFDLPGRGAVGATDVVGEDFEAGH